MEPEPKPYIDLNVEGEKLAAEYEAIAARVKRGGPVTAEDRVRLEALYREMTDMLAVGDELTELGVGDNEEFTASQYREAFGSAAAADILKDF